MARAMGPPLNLNGYTDLPPGTVATIVTYLEMTERPRLRRLERPTEWSVLRLVDPGRYRALFRRVGEPWLWFSRAVMPDDVLAGILGHPKVEAYALHDGAGDIGLFELDFRQEGACQLVYFGLVPEALGHGAGRFLMNQVIGRAFKAPIARLFVHTCSLDHPAALPFYMRSGFRPYKRAVEVAPDPRLTGRLPLDAAPHIPVLPGPAPRTRRIAARPRRATRSAF